jgi:hypothetical protein
MNWDQFRTNAERSFSSIARTTYRHPKKTVVAMLLLAALFIAHLPQITMDTTTEGFLHEYDPTLISYENFRDRYGRDEVILVAIKPEAVFDREFLNTLTALHHELEENVPHLDDITSLINARDTRGEGDALIVEDLLAELPADDAALADVKQRALANPIYKNFLVSEDGAFTSIIMKLDYYYVEKTSTVDALGAFDDGFDEVGPVGGTPESTPTEQPVLTGQQAEEAVKVALSIVEKYKGDNLIIKVAGSPAVVAELKSNMGKDIRKFMLIGTITVAIMLFVMFRRASGVLIPGVVVVLSLLSTVGLMAWIGTPIKLPTQILPSFIAAVSVGAAVHILAIFYYRLAHGDSKEDSIIYAMGHSGLAVLFTSLTTAAGLGSFATAEVAPISDLGRYASFGVIMSLLYTLLLLPALVSIFPIAIKTVTDQTARAKKFDRVLIAIADFATGAPKRIIAVSALLVVIAGYYTARIQFSHNPLTWLPATMEIRQATELVDANMRGSVNVEILVDTGKENGLYDPALLKKMEAFQRELETYKDGTLFIGKTLSLVDMIKEINKALNEGKQEAYVIPATREIVANELFLFENSGSDDLENIVDSRFSQARITAKTPWIDAIPYGRMVTHIEGRAREIFGNDATVEVTGIVTLLGRSLSAAIHSMAESYLIAGVIITLMMVLFLGKVKAGLLSMVPNVAPIIVALGVMGFVGWPMDMFTMLIGSIAIGLAVDDTTHFMHNFHRYFHETNDARQAVRNTLVTSGRAMLVTTIVLATAFFTYIASDMANIFRFGLLTGTALIFALVADFLLAPAIMTLIAQRKPDDV